MPLLQPDDTRSIRSFAAAAGKRIPYLSSASTWGFYLVFWPVAVLFKHSTRHSTRYSPFYLDNSTLTLEAIETTSVYKVGDGKDTWRKEVRYQSISWSARTSEFAGCRRECRRRSSASASA